MALYDMTKVKQDLQGETCRRSAAPLMVPASATATKAASWFIVNAGAPSALATLRR
jgi:hypothetical protein